MATAPISRRLNLTRDQLAQFLSDQQQIRQFELLFSTVDTLQVIIGSDFEYQADNAAATANEALAQISALAQDTAVDDAVLNAKIQEVLDAIPRLAQALELLALAPPQNNSIADGDVVGPASATDNAVARFNGTTGKLIQNSVTTIDDTGNASGILSQQFSNGSAVTLAAGKMWYDGSTGAWNLGMGGGNITQQVGEEIFVYGKASAAITDSPLQIIYHTGVVGASGVITFAPTIIGITDSNAIVGVATESLALNDFGRATVFGTVRGITTNGTAFGETWADDDPIWYNPVTGNPTKVEPVAPNIKIQVGYVIKAGAGGSGSFHVEIIRGSKLGGTDSNVEFGTLANTDLIQYSTSLGYWTNVTPASVINASSGAPITKTANFTVADSENWLINNKTGSTCTVTLPTASSWTGRVLRFQNYQAQTVVSASSNVVPVAGGAAATSILLASTGDSATLVSDGTNWLVTQYIPNNALLLE
jgi:hypothetical protein